MGHIQKNFPRFRLLYAVSCYGGFVKSLKVVTPVKTGAQNYLKRLDSAGASLRTPLSLG